MSGCGSKTTTTTKTGHRCRTTLACWMKCGWKVGQTLRFLKAVPSSRAWLFFVSVSMYVPITVVFSHLPPPPSPSPLNPAASSTCTPAPAFLARQWTFTPITPSCEAKSSAKSLSPSNRCPPWEHPPRRLRRRSPADAPPPTTRRCGTGRLTRRRAGTPAPRQVVCCTPTSPRTRPRTCGTETGTRSCTPPPKPTSSSTSRLL